MKKPLFFGIVAILLVVFAVSGFFVLRYVIQGKQQADRNDQLASIAAGTSAAATTSSTTAATEETTAATTEAGEPVMIAGYEEIYNQNDDTVGWIKMEGTKIDYPVMQTPDEPNFYLKRNFDKEASEWGAIYAWEAADINKPSDNITLFGHCMKDGSMFAALSAYTNKSAWENNSLITFNTLYEYHTYKIFAVFKVSANVGNFAYHQFVDAANEEEFDDFVATCKDLAFYDTGITPKYGDKLITLSTCEYTLDNGRLVVCAVRIS